MQAGLEGYIEGLQRAKTLDDLQGHITGLRDYFDVEHVVYHWVNRGGDLYVALTYSDEWVDRYTEQDYARIDPVVTESFGRFTPVDWKRLDWSGKRARDFMGEACDAGVGSQGFSVPIRGPNGQFALFSVSDRRSDTQWQKHTETHVRELLLAAHFVNQRVLEFENVTDVSSIQKLSPREVDALSFLAMGYSRGQTAEALSISEHTLRVYIESARFKLGASNTTHAVARALALGLLII